MGDNMNNSLLKQILSEYELKRKKAIIDAGYEVAE